EMLRGAGASDDLIDIVQLARTNFAVASQTLSQGAKMLAIVDAFDSMTTEQVFRRALSRERAVDELFAHAGSQFDPQLVQNFAEMTHSPRPELESQLADRWLNQFVPNPTPGFWEADVPVSSGALQNVVDTLFHRRLLDSQNDAVVYLDCEGQILHWNRAAERMTGRQAAALSHRTWSPQLMGLQQQDGQPCAEADFSVAALLARPSHVDSRFQVKHVDGRHFQVQFTSLPVISGQRAPAGLVLLIKDASAQANLEERVQSLRVIATQDNLTKVANRAELDRRLPEFLREHMDSGNAGSLVICDIDHFKRINDTYLHQAGDEALVTFASVLQQLSRDEDLVARYGGEEFVLLCAGCDNPAATARAEEIRREVERTPVPSLAGTTMTASFGVTEIQAGDTPATLLARADRALLTAKNTGRNRVVQLGAGQMPQAPDKPAEERCSQQRASWLNWFRASQELAILESERLACVPIAIAVQKLQGFISDHHAEVLKAEATQVTLKINGQLEGGRRNGERGSVMLMDVTFKGVDYRNPRTNAYQSQTKLVVAIRAVKARDRRAASLRGQANQLLASFNSYLVTQEITDDIRG
ncbi:MAG: diguanylate cyclase, partial [Planctomycetales bacterium]|nr:diguanylate cyclase [Planctomycetales bacterium]